MSSSTKRIHTASKLRNNALEEAKPKVGPFASTANALKSFLGLSRPATANDAKSVHLDKSNSGKQLEAFKTKE